MHITELTLSTQNVQEQQQFYTTTLGLPLIQAQTSTFSVQAGTTRLIFRQTTEKTLYHFAFTIPSNKAAAAKTWLATRTPLLKRERQDVFFSKNWNTDSLYFCDAAGHILECIAHHDLQNERTGDFGADDFLHISEIGMAFENVARQVDVWKAVFGLEVYRNAREEAFAAVGDIHGLFITAQTGRNWFPTKTRAAIVSPIEVTIEGASVQSQTFAPYPYAVQVREHTVPNQVTMESREFW
jgi:catechol-2,3-dioxygenase